MSRKVFFSFHYQRDLWRVNVIRNSGIIEGVAAAGFADASLWEETERHGDAAIKALINHGLDGTSVTVVVIGAETANRKYVDYEITESVARGNGLIGIRVNAIKNQKGHADSPGAVPRALADVRAPIYSWEYGKLGRWVDEAFRAATRRR
jgi:hypothetical protein